MQATDTPPLSADRTAVGDRIAAAPGVVLALDFDGTLAPIVQDPADAAIDDDTRATLAELAENPTVAPAVVSGRQLSDLRERVGLDGVDYAGNHGLELYLDGQRVVPEAAEGWESTVDDLCASLAERLAGVPGAIVENKGLTATVHVRQVHEERRDEVPELVADTVAEVDDRLVVTAGKEIREIRPPIEWDKGRAVERLLAGEADDWLPIYVGDDVTDEDAFEALAELDRETLTVVVGDGEDTAADYRVDAPADVADFLATVAERRR